MTPDDAALKPRVPPRAGFRRHWFNDIPGRLAEALKLGFTHVYGADDKPIYARVGRDLNAFLMEIADGPVISVVGEDRQSAATPGAGGNGVFSVGGGGGGGGGATAFARQGPGQVLSGQIPGQLGQMGEILQPWPATQDATEQPRKAREPVTPPRPLGSRDIIFDDEKPK